MNNILKIDEIYFSTFSREAMKVLYYMIKVLPKKKIFTTEELGKLVGMKGKSFGGVMGTFSKRKKYMPLVIKLGTISVGWEGEKFNRPQQVWALNPKMKKKEIEEIKYILNFFQLNKK